MDDLRSTMDDLRSTMNALRSSLSDLREHWTLRAAVGRLAQGDERPAQYHGRSARALDELRNVMSGLRSAIEPGFSCRRQSIDPGPPFTGKNACRNRLVLAAQSPPEAADYVRWTPVLT